MQLITPHPSVELLQRVLTDQGYSCERLSLGVKHHGYTRYTAPNGKSWLTQDAHIGYPFTTRAATSISTRKDIAYEFCAARGIRVPKTTEFMLGYDESELAQLPAQGPLVVKPHNSSLSRGLTLNVTDADALREALRAAHAISPVALVQEQIRGEEIRFTVVDGHVKAALLRQSPQLVGTGKLSLGELLDIENRERSQLVLPYLTYPQLRAERILEAGHSLTDIPAEGEVVLLGDGTMVRDGASIYNILAEVHNSYIQSVIKLSSALGTRFIAVDMMLEDYKAPQTADNYAFIEFNTAPVLKLFYSCRDGKHYDVLSDLVKVIDDSLR